MVMNFNAKSARAAVSEYEEQKRAEVVAAAGSKISSIENAISCEAKMGHRFHTVLVEVPAIGAKIREILEENGFSTMSDDGKNIRIEW